MSSLRHNVVREDFSPDDGTIATGRRRLRLPMPMKSA
jgi:hypothetical protein